ncbi:hypothetical protein Poli38472_011969 [Pythium oligandrum]|uniref:Protein kinase domain-containing protein n=1 Tax=Pythium oligandrum TaxID=41045 RepID=A0A8K1FQR7_PYTOL|nr:hypothetical protein Poli38472_011969 [Pythium oligandrum]|eukprot:TMW66853.1 hypothetical protein Poli38472_011969 [Pythium oligandrum]
MTCRVRVALTLTLWLLVLLTSAASIDGSDRDREAGDASSAVEDDPTTPPPTTTTPPVTTPPPTTTPPPPTTPPPTTTPPPPTTPPPTTTPPPPTTPPPTTTPPPSTTTPPPTSEAPVSTTPPPETTTPAPTTVTPTPTPTPKSSSNTTNSTKAPVDTSVEDKKDNTPGTETITTETKKKSDSSAVVIAVVIGAAVVLIGILYVASRYRKRKEETRDHFDSYERYEIGTCPATQTDTNRERLTETGLERTAYHSVRESATKSSTSRSSQGTRSSMADDTLSELWRNPEIVAARIPFEKLQRGEMISRGGFGEVYEGVYRGQRVAIKQLDAENRKKMACLEDLLLEGLMLIMLEHERIITLVGVAWDSPRELCLVLEHMAKGDLRTILSEWKREGRPTGWDKQKLEIVVHVAEGLTYLHSMSPKIVHRDLKSRNVLLNDEWNAKLSDFGVSREESTHRTMTSNVGSSLWIAPEVMMGNDYNEKADIFSFGILLTELDSHQLPYHNVKTPDGRDVPDAAILHMVTMGKIQAEFSAMSRTDMVLLGRACLSLDPASRPSAPEIRYRVMQIIRSL